ncbi:MAG: glycosyltransferase domain-containing protein [Pseudomonadota bacterium]|uniref:PLOD1-3-like GT domain-containing protein n=1 Tax=viral metagenome TaxID=1070528 RepID=A0A6H1ZG74_9ZZZZ
MTLTVIAHANIEGHHFHAMKSSAEKHGYHLKIFNGKWHGLRSKITTLYTASKTEDCDLLMLVDAFDTIFMAGPGKVMDLYEKHEGKALFSAEKACWPPHPVVNGRYIHTVDTPWRYLNSGGFIGPRKLFTDLLDKAWDEWNNKYDHGLGDQYFYHCLYLDNQNTIALDTGCEIFQSMAHHSLDGWIKGPDFIENPETGTMPVVLHFNGMTPMDGYLHYAE